VVFGLFTGLEVIFEFWNVGKFLFATMAEQWAFQQVFVLALVKADSSIRFQEVNEFVSVNEKRAGERVPMLSVLQTRGIKVL
jgi:hypothetical protein